MGKAAVWRRDRAVRGVLASRCRRPGVQAAEFKMKELLMVEVPRTHSAKLLLLHLVMVGVPTNTFAMDENNPRRRPGVQAAEFNPRSPRWSPRIYGPGVQAEAMCIQDGCRTHPGGPSVRWRRRTADLEFWQLQHASEADVSLVQGARGGARGSTDLESRPKRCASRMDAEHTQEVRV